MAVRCSYLDSGNAEPLRGESGSGPNLCYTRRGWPQVFLSPLYGRSEVLGTSGCTGIWRDTGKDGQMDRTEGIEDSGGEGKFN